MEVPKRDGWVYILKPVGHNVYKVGCTTDLARREKTMGKAYGFDIEYVAFNYYSDYEGAERWWHEHFKKRNKYLIGEWFLLTSEDIHYFIMEGTS